MEVRRILVVGAGQMGTGIAQVAAQSGFTVHLNDVSPSLIEKALGAIRGNLDRAVEKGRLSAEAREAAAARIEPAPDLATAGGADLVVEAIVENVEAKKGLFARLDAACGPHTLLATNTSSISITELAASTKRPDRFVGMHFFNPVPVMKLVEIIRGIATSQETVETAKSVALKMEKTPVEVQDSPGFAGNRMLLPMINEAFYCLMEGVASAEDIDTVMKLGMNHPMGPLALADLIGLDTCLSILEVLNAGFGDPKYRPCPLLRKMVKAGYLGRKTGRGVYTYQ
ncbi:MAG: 3-hydroxybutyryl-CoA dehydrogenase [Firmicutes bacterium]|jgi:3-hydroxybutyryl-CoA dehydrogenase|nr:3-hydroxybutyryl-CoA dehydrogenase [Bacillota bacterium]